MKKDRGLIIGLLALFVAIGLFIGLYRPPSERPLDSRSNLPQGTRALYLTLEELGFHVDRKLGPIGRMDDGVILVFGAEDLASEDLDAVDAWEARGNLYYVVESPESFANGTVSPRTVSHLVVQLWAYRDRTVWFDEYGRGQALASFDVGQTTPVSILPDWVFALLVQIGILALLCLLLLGNRVGPPRRTELSRRRDEREDVNALATLMERSQLTQDALDLCYRRLTDTTKEQFPHMEAELALEKHRQPMDPDRAVALSAAMDRLREETRRQ